MIPVLFLLAVALASVVVVVFVLGVAAVVVLGVTIGALAPCGPACVPLPAAPAGGLDGVPPDCAGGPWEGEEFPGDAPEGRGLVARES